MEKCHQKEDNLKQNYTDSMKSKNLSDAYSTKENSMMAATD